MQRTRQWTRRRLRTECTSLVLRASRLSADRRNTSPSLSSMKSQDGQAQLRQTGFRWIKAYALLEPLQQLREYMEAPSFDHPEAIAAAMGVLDRHLAALSGDAVALAQTLHFPHYRLAEGRMKIWERSETYLQDFYARVGNEWRHSAWDFRKPISSSSDKVHLDVQFSRYRTDGSVLGRYRSLWVVSLIDQRWAAQLRSSFAP